MNKLGNPAIAAAASNPDIIKSGKEIIVATQQRALSTIKIAFGLVTGAVTIWYANKKFKEWQKQKFVENNAHMPDVQAAMIMRKAMFKVEFDTFPFSMITVPDGTNEAMLNSLALKVTSLNNVVKAYKVLFESNLLMDVSSELNDKELQKFFENLGAKNEYSSQFNADGSIKPQKAYRVGATIEVKNPQGAAVLVADEYATGKYRATKDSRAFVAFSKTIGTIVAVYKGNSGAYYYVVDMDNFSFMPDWIYGYGWASHVDVKVKI